MSAVAWYEFTRGPRTPQNLEVATSILSAVVAFDTALAERAAELFRQLGSPRSRANDIAIAATAVQSGAILLTRNRADFEDIPGLVLA